MAFNSLKVASCEGRSYGLLEHSTSHQMESQYVGKLHKSMQLKWMQKRTPLAKHPIGLVDRQTQKGTVGSRDVALSGLKLLKEEVRRQLQEVDGRDVPYRD